MCVLPVKLSLTCALVLFDLLMKALVACCIALIVICPEGTGCNSGTGFLIRLRKHLKGFSKGQRFMHVVCLTHTFDNRMNKSTLPGVSVACAVKEAFEHYVFCIISYL